MHRGIIDLADQDILRALAENTLGPVNLRSPERATTEIRGTYKGGTAFERSLRARGVKGTRCYTTAYSHQRAPNIVSATTGSKRTGGDLDNLQLRTEVNLVRCVLLLPSDCPLILKQTVPTISAHYCRKNGTNKLL